MNLPAATSAMKPSATVNSASAAEASVAVEVCSTVETTNRSTSDGSAHCSSRTAVESGAASEARTTVESAAAVEARAAIESAVEPRSSTDEETARKVARPVVTVRCASVRIISVVAVSACGGTSDVARSNSHADRHSLRTGVRRRRQANPK